MGLLKRLFSIGIKKNKKKRPPIVHNVPLQEEPFPAMRTIDDEEHEAAVGRLLRSSSARYVERAELDYATLPPLPHPINRVIETPASSTVSLASTSLSQHGTYNVTVHKRRRHTPTEFPHANRDLQDKPSSNTRASLLPAEDSRILRLRSDPSVASLLELYDEHGKLANDAFSNSPPPSPKQERAQCRRSGSTFRQLLGAPLSLKSRGANDSGEGDISWAERFLAETEATSSSSSLVLHTPSTPEFPQEYAQPEIRFVADGDISNTTFNNPAISSMEVEIDDSRDISQDFGALHKKNNPYSNSDPSTPQRASQVFKFLTRGKQSKAVEDMDRSLPELPSCFSSPSDENVCDKTSDSDRSTEFVFAPPRFSAIPIPLTDDTPRTSRPPSSLIQNTPIPMTRISQEPRSAFSDDSHDYQHISRTSTCANQEPQFDNNMPTEAQETKQNDIKVIMTGPTKVIVTAPTPSTNHNGPSRLPRGPRALPRKKSSGSATHRRSALVELSNSSTADPFTVAPSRRKPQNRRSSSTSSVNSMSRKTYEQHAEYSSRTKNTDIVSLAGQQKENRLALSVKTELPSTPLRSNTTGSRSLLRTVIQQSMFRPPAGMTPSPASSSEMSPVGRQIMTDVRQQRMKARGADRERSGSRFGADRNGQRI